MVICEKRQQGDWYIRAGGFFATGKDPREVREKALEELATITSNTERGYVACADGTVIAVYWFDGGYGFDVVHPGIAVKSDGVIYSPSREWGYKTFGEAVQQAKCFAEKFLGEMVPGKVTGLGALQNGKVEIHANA